MTDLVVTTETELLEVQDLQPEVLDAAEEAVLLEVAEQGPPGPRGPIGPAGGGAVTKVAGQNLSGHRVLAGRADGAVIYAGSNLLGRLPIGLSLGAALEGDSVDVQLSGEIVEPSWAWDVTLPVYAGVDGVLTQTAPVSGLLVVVGFPGSPTSLMVSISDPILLE